MKVHSAAKAVVVVQMGEYFSSLLESLVNDRHSHCFQLSLRDHGWHTWLLPNWLCL
jgi:hypothetical protein